MSWWSIRIDPLPLPQRLIPRPSDRSGGAGPAYQLWLPLIPDGRIYLPLFQAEPARARIIGLPPAGGGPCGRIELRDHQWFCTWPPGGGSGQTDLRIIGSRFVPGEIIGLRPVRGVIVLYRVVECSPS